MRTAPRWLGLAAAALLTGCGGVSSRGKATDCEGCHSRKTLAAQWALPQVHEPFRDRSGCDACHGRHGEQGKNVLVEPEQGLCLRCHEGAAFGRGQLHGAMQTGGCSGCHEPHAGKLPKLLDRPREALCAECHPDVAKAHGGREIPPARCGGCHDPHSGVAGTKLLHEVSHPILADCGACHAAPSRAAPFALAKPQPALC
jgi:predicted CXXCH cytochrome family protein